MKHVVIKRIGIFITFFLLVFFSSKAFSFPYKGLDLKINGKIAEIYDDNIDSDTAENEMDDFITRLSLAFGTKYEGKTQSMDFTGRIKQEIYLDNSDFSNTSGSLTADYRNELTEYDSIRLTDVFYRTFKPRTIEEEFGRTEGHYKSMNNTIDFTYSKSFSEQFSVNANYSNSIFVVSSEGGDDSNEHSLGSKVNYAYSVDTIFYLGYQFSTRRFGESGNSSTHTVTSGVKRYITERLSFDVIVGADFITDSQDNTIEGEYVALSVTNEVNENTSAELSYVKRIQNFGFVDDFYDSWRISGSVISGLSERIGSKLSAFYGEGTYDQSGRSNKLLGGNVGLNYNFSERLSGGVGYSYSRNRSTKATGNTKITRSNIATDLSIWF